MSNKNILLLTLIIFIAKTSVLGKLYPRVVADRDRITKADWEQLAGAGKIVRPQCGVILRTNGGQPVILFTDYSANKVGFVKYIETFGTDADSVFLKDYGSCGTGANQFCSPNGFKILNTNDIYIADAGNNRVSRGLFYMNDFYITASTPVASSAGLNEPMDIEPYNEGGIIKIYVADTKNNRILRLNSSGAIEQAYGSTGSGIGQFKKPQAIARHGNFIYIADMYNDRIVALYEELNGTFTWYNTFSAPEGLALFTSVDCDMAGNVFFVDQAHCKIYKFTEGLGEMLWAQGSRGIYRDQYQDPVCININEGTDDALIVEAWTPYTGLRLLRNRIDILSAQASKILFEPAKENLTITYKTDDAAKMLIRVVTETNDTLKRTLVNNFTFPAGTTSLVWDGKDSLGHLILPGKYKIAIQAIDGYGNIATKYVNITVKGTRCPQNIKLHGSWTSENSPYVILGAQTQQYNADSALYLNPGTEVMFWPNDGTKYQFVIYDTIKAVGTAEEPILFTSYRKEDERDTSDWRSIYLAAKCSTSIFKNCIFEYGGAGAAGTNDRSNIHFAANAIPRIENCIIRKRARYGIYSGGTINGPIIDNVFSDNAYYPLRLGPDGIGQTHGNIFTNNGIQGIEVNEGTVQHNATWQNQGVPYYAPTAFAVWTSEAGKRCTLTVAAGCSLLFGTVSTGGYALGIGYTYGYNVYKGHFICQGTMLQPVTLAPMVPDTGWQGITVHSGGSANLQYTTVRGAKRVSQASYSLYCMNAPGDTVIAQHCNFEDGDSIGINLPGNYGPVILENCRVSGNRCIGLYSDRTNRNLRISETIFENNGTYPLVLPPKQIDGILSATFTNNGNNVIRVKYGAVDSNVIWRNFNVPYYLEKNCQVGVRSPAAASVCTLTIAPRCTVLMDSNSYFQAGWSGTTPYRGVLLADGEGGEIVFKSVNASNKSGLMFETQSGGYLNKCTFLGGGGSVYGIDNAKSIIRSNTTEFVMRQCRVTGSDSIGLYLGASPQQVKYCEFAFNPIGIYSAGTNVRYIDSSNIWNNGRYGAYCVGTGQLNAKNCWWGHTTGPYDPSSAGSYNPDGLGDKVSDLVIYDPWLTKPLLMQIISTNGTATAFNNGKRLLYDNVNKLHLTYVSGDSVIYQQSGNDGYSWDTPAAFYSGGAKPVPVLGWYDNDTMIVWKVETENAGWLLKNTQKTSSGWDVAQTLLETAGNWEEGHIISPPTLALNSQGAHLAFERIDSRSNIGGQSGIWVWKLIYGFKPLGGNDFEYTELDSATGTWDVTPPNNLACVTISVDTKDGIQIAWDREGEIYWKLYDPQLSEWKDKINLTNSPEVASKNPSLSIFGDVHLVWEEGNDIYHQKGNWGLPLPENNMIAQFSWGNAENVSNNVETPSTDPVFAGNYAAWSELLENGDKEVYLANYVDFAWLPYENYSNNQYLYSLYPQIAFRQNTTSSNVATVWTEGRDPLYSLMFRDTAGPFTPEISADVGGATPSLYTIERDGFITYTIGKSSTITVDYDSTALLYYLPYLDKDKENIIKIGLYQEYDGKHQKDYFYKISVDNIPLGVVKVPSGEKVIFEKKLPPPVAWDGEGILKIENLTSPMQKGIANCDWWQLYAYDKVTGGCHPHGGAQSEEVTSITPNYINKLYQNCPNPFNNRTTFMYQLKNQGLVTFKVYNTLGQLVRTLVNETKPAGAYQVDWNGRDDGGRQAASGVYFYRINAGSFEATKKLIVLK